MSELSERLSDADYDALARVIRAIRLRRAEHKRQESLARNEDSRRGGS